VKRGSNAGVSAFKEGKNPRRGVALSERGDNFRGRAGNLPRRWVQTGSTHKALKKHGRKKTGRAKRKR